MAMNMQQTKTRIRSVTSTSKITKAMELVSTAKLKKAKDLNEKVTPFKEEVLNIASYVAKNIQDKDFIYFNENKEETKDLYIVITSNLGLCGGYNVNVYKKVNEIVNADEDSLLVIGLKGYYYFKNKNYHIVDQSYDFPGFDVKENISKQIANYVTNQFSFKKYRSIKLIYTKFVNSLTFIPEVTTLLPVKFDDNVSKMKKELLLEPSAEEVLENLIPFYLTTTIKTLLFESMLSEQASRRTSMETATDNANELKEKLLLEYNKSRQASITQEITEISSAANAKQ